MLTFGVAGNLGPMSIDVGVIGVLGPDNLEDMSLLLFMPEKLPSIEFDIMLKDEGKHVLADEPTNYLYNLLASCLNFQHSEVIFRKQHHTVSNHKKRAIFY